jgi:hypothetical protein
MLVAPADPYRKGGTDSYRRNSRRRLEESSTPRGVYVNDPLPPFGCKRGYPYPQNAGAGGHRRYAVAAYLHQRAGTGEAASVEPRLVAGPAAEAVPYAPIGVRAGIPLPPKCGGRRAQALREVHANGRLNIW